MQHGLIRTATVKRNGKFIELQFPFDKKLLMKVDKLEGRKWNQKKKVWTVPGSRESLQFVLDNGFRVSDVDGQKMLDLLDDLDLREKNRGERMKLAMALEAPKIEEVARVMKLEAHPYQWVPCHYSRVSDGRFCLFDEPGIGKQQPISEPVLTPHGWVPIGQLIIGDSVIGSNGKPTKVTGVFPQVERKTYKMTFSDGSWTKCGPDHLWKVWTHNDTFRNPKGRVMSTEDILSSGLRDVSGKRKYRIPLVDPVEFEEQQLTIPPYVFGAILGDGSINAYGRGNVTTCDEEMVSFTACGSVHVKPKRSNRKETYVLGFNEIEYRRELRDLGLCRKRSFEKWIPEKYLYSSVDQRKELLAALLDTDGYAIPTGGTEFTTTSSRLADDVEFLVESLGGIVKRGKEKVGSYRGPEGDLVECRKVYRLNIKTEFNPFKLERKRLAWKRPSKYPSIRLIESIELDKDEDSVCISVEAEDRLYVTRHCVVTHNTVQSLMVTYLPEYRGQIVLIVTPVPYTFQAELLKFFGVNSMVLEKPLDFLNPRIRYYIVSPHRLKWLIEDHTLKPREMKAKECWRGVFLILDECHLYKNRDAQRSQYAKALARTSEQLIAMTGTPIMNRTNELYNALSMVVQGFMSWTAFTAKYCNASFNGYGTDTSGNSNSQSLRGWLYENKVVKREKKNVLTQLPDKVRQLVQLVQTPIHVKAASMFEMYSNSAKIKSEHPLVTEWIEDLITETEKVVIFAHHAHMMDAVQRICEKLKVKFIRIDGNNESEEERHKLVKKFETDPSYRVSITSIGCGGTGLNGLQVAQVMAALEYPWVPGILIQAEDRLHRGGQQGSVLIFNVVLTEFDFELIHMIIEKWSIASRVTGNQEISDSISKESLMNAMAEKFKLPLYKRIA